HRINMRNLKRAALDPPPLATPLSPEELAAEEAQAAADAAELAAARQKGSGVFGGNEHSMMEDVDPPKTPDPLRPEADESDDRGQDSVDSQPPTGSPSTEYSVPSTPLEAPHDGPPETAGASAATLNLESVKPAEGRLH